MAEVQIFTDPSGPTRWRLMAARVVIGRDGTADITIDDPLASRQHAVITLVREGVYQVEDLGSKNGVLVNGTKYPKRELADGDVIRIGRTDMKFIADIPVYVPAMPATVVEPPPARRPAMTPREAHALAADGAGAFGAPGKSPPLVHAESSPRITATHRIAALEDSVRAKDAEISVLRQALKKRGLDSSSEAPSSEQALLGDGVLEFITPSCETLGGPMLAGTSQRRASRRPAPQMSFLGFGPSGDRFIAEITTLGHRRALAVIEALVPPERIASARENRRTIAEGGVAQSIGREIEPLARTFDVLKGAGLKPVTDFFLVGDLESFGEGADAYLEVERVLDVVFPDETTRPRVHAIVFGRAWKSDAEVPAEWRGWQSLIVSRRIASVIVCDRDRGFDAADPDRAQTVARTAAGILDGLWRASHFPTQAGTFGAGAFSEMLIAGGFSTFALVRAEGSAEKVLAKMRETLLPGGLAWPGAPTAFARALTLVWIVEREAFADALYAERIVEDTSRELSPKVPQARITTSVFAAVRPGALCYAWVGGVLR